MIEEVKGIKITCDGCGSVTLIEEHEEALVGVYGTAWEINGGGGSGSAEWYACKKACISKAVAAALTRAWDQ